MKFIPRKSVITLLCVLAAAIYASPPSRARSYVRDREPRWARPALPEDAPLRSTPVILLASERRLAASLVVPSGSLDLKSTHEPTQEVKIELKLAFEGGFMQLEATVDASRQKVTWTSNGAALTEQGRDALRRLALELEASMLTPDVQPHEEWAYRLVNLWAEAPLNRAVQLRRVVELPTRTRERTNGAVPVPEGRDDAVQSNTASRDKCKGCNVEGGTGIDYLSGGCRVKTYSAKHDACVKATGKGHCYTKYSVTGGCDRTNKCVGRCGPGCGIAGAGIYTTDCLAHDHCVRHDNAAACCADDPKCGDEFWDAEGDFLFGWFNCNNGCK